MTGAALLGAIALAGAIAVGFRAWVQSARTDPRRDPGARSISAEARAQLEGLVARGGPPAVVVAEALDICAVEGWVWWRGGLARVADAAAALDDTPDERALAAEYALRLGKVAEAARLVAPLPAVHGRACEVRAELYAIAGDVVRAESAWVAAAQLGAPSRRAVVYARLHASRRRRGVAVAPYVARWEGPPD